MKTKINILIEKLNVIRKRMVLIMGVSHTQDDYSMYMKHIGSEIEIFLKDAVYENLSNNLNLYNLIEGLKLKGITQDSIDKLHKTRDLYNQLKHDPNFTTSIIYAEETVVGLLQAVQEIKTKSIGRINNIHTQINSRVLWFCAWDDYIGGMTELNLFLPNDDLDFPHAVEYFNIALEGWDILKAKYLTTGELQLGKQYVSEKAYKIWKANTDLIGLGRFTGDIKDLVKTLSLLVNKDRERNLIEGLKRENDPSSNFTSVTYAIQDTLVNNDWTNFEDFKNEIKLRIDLDYSIDLDSKILNLYTEKLKSDFITIDRDKLSQVNEILWLSGHQFEKIEIRVLFMEKPYIALTRDNNIAVKIN